LDKFHSNNIDKIIAILSKEYTKWRIPAVTLASEESKDPFRVLISTILSLRTKDETTYEASKRLFKLADNPTDMLKFSMVDLEKVIYPVGFYRTKAKTILNICDVLKERCNSKVPNEVDELLKLKGVGRKTANLVVTLAFGKLGICVDTHVHRISNRWGFVSTKTPLQTEMALRERLPEKYWVRFNSILVAFGQQICRPISPKCTVCPVERYCEKVGVSKSR